MSSNVKGLTTSEARNRLKKYGPNLIRRTHKVSPVKIFLAQFASPLIWLLVAAALTSVFIGYLPGQEPNYVDAFLIIFIVIVSGIAGFVQEYKAEKSIEALQKMALPQIEVVRDEEVKTVPIAEIVVGDIVILEAGDIVPADGKIVESYNLKVDESVLTGESVSIDKEEGDEVFMNTSVFVGSAKMRVTKTGMKTKIGRIARKLEEIGEEKTVFEQEIAEFSKKVFWITIIITLAIFGGNLLKYDLYTSVLTAISLAVAAIPEGLPAVVVLALAFGAKVMYQNNALIKRLGVVESIGAVDVICSDKTGTLTKNEMTVLNFYLGDEEIKVDSLVKQKKIGRSLRRLIECGVVCNDTKIEGHPEAERKYYGDQTEVALIKVGEQLGIYQEHISDKFVRIDEVAFSSERKMMSVTVKDNSKKQLHLIVYAKGAPEVLLEKCRFFLDGNSVRPLRAEDKKKILAQSEKFSSDALRVLGFAYKEGGEEVHAKPEEDLVWIGLQAMSDPPHPEIVQVLKECRTAGIRVIMITGDSLNTAVAIADKIGLKSKGALTGQDIDRLGEGGLKEKLASGVNIFARTNPFHKLKILKILKADSRVAMTGDGVNDALALKQADVGIAMGKKGTTVAKESSDIILLDDNFATIVTAVKEGRRIFNNIRKFINYLLVSNLAEVFVIFLSTLFFTLQKPILLPIHILWINLLTDGMPALALGVDPAGRDVMKEPPRRKNEPIIDRKLGWLIGAIGAKKTLILLLTFILVLPAGEGQARTALFTGFILYEFVRIASIRSQEKLGWFSNSWLVLALSVSLLLQFLIIYTPLNSYFHVEALGVYGWSILGAGVVIGYS
ncbi:cation-translocating P-type ATPase, partial [Candidatus Parcubacteria bacterium]